ncbi:AI-2E family transporter [Coraliomargarita akajimensis]|uniref:AI-2E family transporter n=1 Tax=Coraliomargarita akajimensis (strain DSM 45221 / IAM 15411 / JCM 23193 / KCTC 12865 / 04OKA010-24) TaxID=583355 RepID=D5EHY4_CORAD|nr:AI-2E family transporter [Coraliomargarita akajimensis]ADE56024.1 protein of unknown function UPF0118 [Coraliomargarita akajimensis DSM 45221]
MPEDTTPTLSAFQKRIIAAGGTAIAAVVLIATFFFTFVLLRGFVAAFQDVLLPLAIAAIVATLLRPFVTFLETRTRLSKLHGIILLYVLVILVCGVALVAVVPATIEQTTRLIKHLPELTTNLSEQLQTRIPEAWAWLEEKLGEPPEAFLQRIIAENSEIIKGGITSSVGSATGLVGDLFGKIAAYSIIPVYLFFILNGDRNIWTDLERQIDFLPKDRREDLVFLARQFSDILIAFFRGQIIIGLLLGVVLGLGFALVGLKFGLFLGLILGLLNIIPYLGTMLGILTVLPLAHLQPGGGTNLIILCSIVFIIGQLLTDYVFTPRIMGDKTGMGPMLIIFSIFFWGTALGGILGMVLAIPLTAFFLVFWRLAREKYLPALIQQKREEHSATS